MNRSTGLRHSRLRGGERGASLIEVLIAMVIFAFGALGLAGLQVRALSFGQSSLYRSQASVLTDDIMDRMRADRANAVAGRWDTTAATASTAITGTAIFQTDLADWKAQVEALLPGGTAAIAVTATEARVTIQWVDDRHRDADDPERLTTFVTVSRL